MRDEEDPGERGILAAVPGSGWSLLSPEVEQLSAGLLQVEAKELGFCFLHRASSRLLVPESEPLKVADASMNSKALRKPGVSWQKGSQGTEVQWQQQCLLQKGICRVEGRPLPSPVLHVIRGVSKRTTHGDRGCLHAENYSCHPFSALV